MALVMIASAMMLLPPVVADSGYATSTRSDLNGVRVAVYVGPDALNHSGLALARLFEWMNATVQFVTPAEVKGSVLDSVDIIAFPGGYYSSYSRDLGESGKQKIIDFVRNGGSYFGICGGSIFGASSLRFFNGSVRLVNEPGNPMHLTIMHINRTSAGPDLSDCPENVSTMYWTSSYFSPREGAAIIPIALYDYNDRPGMIALNYGQGTVFLSSPHPEYEEGSNQDGTTFGDELSDPESEWGVLLRVSSWLIDASAVQPTTTNVSPSPSTYTSPDPLTIGLLSVGLVFVTVGFGFWRWRAMARGSPHSA